MLEQINNAIKQHGPDDAAQRRDGGGIHGRQPLARARERANSRIWSDGSRSLAPSDEDPLRHELKKVAPHAFRQPAAPPPRKPRPAEAPRPAKVAVNAPPTSGGGGEDWSEF